ncbi:hypothetical protein AVEN_149228-1 [Araneus ventricosus]|uniref:Uncharacterized protein n=1 Tax=Araneus ventricosus TaxID=182803 RepID=A0A4Y2M063_ARAVE|nr:hypothetical protein AVEN_149228-1 [Araneus ventricosus]
MAGDTLAQASVIRFQSSCNVGGGLVYTRCLMYPQRKKSSGFWSGEREGHSTQPSYPKTCCWNVSRVYCWTLDTLCGGRRRVGTIHSGGHSTANPLENRILRPSFSLFFRVMPRYNFGSCEQNKYTFTPSIFNITIRKVSSLTKSMMLIMLNKFVIDFFLVYGTVFEIRTLTSNFVIRWRCKRFPCVADDNFTTPRPHFHDYSSCRSEIIGVTTDFSGHTVYATLTYNRVYFSAVLS